MTLRNLVVSAATALALVSFGDGFAGVAQAQVLPVLNPADFNSPTGIQIFSQSSNSAIYEGDNAFMTFMVKNNTANFLILDLAALVIGNAVPDPTDAPYNPFNISFSPYIAPGGIGVYEYGAVTDPPDEGDFGISPISFQIYMTEIAGLPTSLPAVVNTLPPCPPPAQFAGCTVLTFYEPFLNPPFLVGPQHEADNFANLLPFRVNDTPEPSVLSLIGIGGLGLLGLRRLRNRAA